MIPEALERISIRWLPGAAYEDTKTIALNVGGYFMDLRVTKENPSIEWAQAGERTILNEDPKTCRWTHVIDSLNLTEPDEAQLFTLPNGDELEVGSTANPLENGAISSFEEVWRNVTLHHSLSKTSWILQSSEGTVFIGKVGNISLALSKISGTGFVARREDSGKDGQEWEVTFESGDASSLPRAAQVEHQLSNGQSAWKNGDSLEVGDVVYIACLVGDLSFSNLSTVFPVIPGIKRFNQRKGVAGVADKLQRTSTRHITLPRFSFLDSESLAEMNNGEDVLLHYFDLGSLGRGEIVRLFLRELGIAFEDRKYAYDETWKPLNTSLGISLTGNLPILEIDSHKLSQVSGKSAPAYLPPSRRANAYEGQSNYEKYLVDAVSDLYVDWRAAWVPNIGAPTDEYRTKTVPHYYNIFSTFYSTDKTGPYLLGNKPTYVDFAIFQVIDNDSVIGTSPVKPAARIFNEAQRRNLESAYVE
ncbi:hypothetical protein G7046_g2487 [Stylonectria norvegica]|nr:hypothetical protein G7046_g2487 [Stylonectria norvegica]